MRTDTSDHRVFFLEIGAEITRMLHCFSGAFSCYKCRLSGGVLLSPPAAAAAAAWHHGSQAPAGGKKTTKDTASSNYDINIFKERFPVPESSLCRLRPKKKMSRGA